jgi:hypothetical protein
MIPPAQSLKAPTLKQSNPSRFLPLTGPSAGINNRWLSPIIRKITCHERLGGLLMHYTHRAA